MTNDEKRLLYTVEQTAQLLGISRTTVYELVKAKRLHEVHIGRSGRFTGAELERFAGELDAQSRRAAPATRRRRGRQPTPTDQRGLFDLPQQEADADPDGDDHPETGAA